MLSKLASRLSNKKISKLSKHRFKYDFPNEKHPHHTDYESGDTSSLNIVFIVFYKIKLKRMHAGLIDFVS